MGNQTGINTYPNYQLQGSQIGQQMIPYANISNAWAYQAQAPSIVNGYQAQGYPQGGRSSLSKVAAQPIQMSRQNIHASQIQETPQFPNYQLNPIKQTQIFQQQPGLNSPSSILQNKNLLSKSSLMRTDRSSSKQKRIKFTDQVPRSVQVSKANIKLSKEQLDKLASNSQSQLFSVMEQIDSQINQAIPNPDILIFLLTVKKTYEQSILKIRMKQQRLAKAYMQINNKSESDMLQINQILQNTEKLMSKINQSLVHSWKQLVKSQTHPDFKRLVQIGKADPIIMGEFQKDKNKVQAAFSRLSGGLTTSDVRSVMSSIENHQSQFYYGGYNGSYIKPTQSMTSKLGTNVMSESITRSIHDPTVFPYASNTSIISNQSTLSNQSVQYPIKNITTLPLNPIQPIDFAKSSLTSCPPQFQTFTPNLLPTSTFRA